MVLSKLFLLSFGENIERKREQKLMNVISMLVY